MTHVFDSNEMLFVLAFSLFLVTFVHHLYGGVIYKTKWRIDGSLVFAFAGMPLLVLLYWLSRSFEAARIAYLLYVIIMWGVLIGLFEGGYNHTLKIVLWSANVKPNVMERLFPPKEYVMPNNIFFEATGVLSFVLGLWVLWLAVSQLI